MLKHHITIAIRNMLRYKFYSMLNILGLAMGLAAFIVIGLYLLDEWSYDKFQKDSDRLFRVTQTNIWDDDQEQIDALGPAVAQSLLEGVPEIEMVTRIHNQGNFLISVEDKAQSKVKTFDESKVFAVDSNFFQMFDFELLEGKANQVLKQPNTIVLSEESAQKYFGNQSALGKVLKVSQGKQEKSFLVTGVFKSLQEQKTHLDFDMLLSMTSFLHVKERNWSWIWTTFVTYIKVKENTSVSELQAKLKELPSQYAEPTIKRIFDYDYAEYVKNNRPWYLYAQAFGEVYLHSAQIGNRIGTVGDIQYFYAFLVIAGIIILLSCINFINLTTARATQRAKEVGVRKVIGSSNQNLIYQFLGEAIILSLIASILALMLAEGGLYFFNKITMKSLSIGLLFQPIWLPFLIFLPFMIGALAGLYPAFYLSRFLPTAVLKGKPNRGKQGKLLRNVLVVTQFSMSAILIISALILYQQLSFWQNKKLGFDRENLLVIPKVERLGKKMETFRQKLVQNTNITDAGFSDSSPPYVWSQDYYKLGQKDADETYLYALSIGNDYLNTLGVELLKGRFFSKEFGTDSTNVIINETTAQKLALKDEEVIGKKIFYENQEFKVIGVVKDFNFSSLKFDIEPLLLLSMESDMYKNIHRYLTLRINNPSKTKETLATVQSTWEEFSPIAFEYQFLNQLYQQTFQAEQTTFQVLMIFTGLALFIAALGLIGLATFSAERRSKEIGIRKVLGASVTQIFGLLSREYTYLILIALLIASPISYWLMENWLQDFAFRIQIDGFSFLVATLIISSVATLAIIYQSLKSAFVNPIDSLKDE